MNITRTCLLVLFFSSAMLAMEKSTEKGDDARQARVARALMPTSADGGILAYVMERKSDTERCGICGECEQRRKLTGWEGPDGITFAHQACVDLIAPVEHDAKKKLAAIYTSGHDVLPGRVHMFLIRLVNRARECEYARPGSLKSWIEQGRAQHLKELFNDAAAALIPFLSGEKSLDELPEPEF